MATQYNINKYVFGVNGFGSPFCDDTYTARLAATTDTTFTVPGITAPGLPSAPQFNKYLAVFAYAHATVPVPAVFVALNEVAAAPAGASFAASTSELNPSAKMVKAGDVIHAFAVNASTDMSIALYPIQE